MCLWSIWANSTFLSVGFALWEEPTSSRFGWAKMKTGAIAGKTQPGGLFSVDDVHVVSFLAF